MKHQPLPSYESNDDIQTPQELADLIARELRGDFYGNVLEPCVGDGNFARALVPYFRDTHACEIKNGSNFLETQMRVDWIVTNPPWSQYKAFMEKSFQVANNVVFLATLNHGLGLRARWNLCDKYGFGVRKIFLLDTPPKPWPQSGFQLGAIWWSKAYDSMPILMDLRGEIDYNNPKGGDK